MNAPLLAIAFLLCWASGVQAQEVHFTASLQDIRRSGVSASGMFTVSSNVLSFAISVPGVAGAWTVSAGPGEFSGQTKPFYVGIMSGRFLLPNPGRRRDHRCANFGTVERL